MPLLQCCHSVGALLNIKEIKKKEKTEAKNVIIAYSNHITNKINFLYNLKS